MAIWLLSQVSNIKGFGGVETEGFVGWPATVGRAITVALGLLKAISSLQSSQSIKMTLAILNLRQGQFRLTG